MTTYIGPVDTFAASYGGVWTTVGAGCAVTSGRSRQEITTGYIGEITTANSYTFDEGVTLVEVVIDATGDNRDVYLYVGKSGAAKAVVNVVGSTIYFVTGGTSSSLTYDATAHRWWRMTESGADIVFDTSPDGTTWTTRRTAIAHGMDMTAVRVLLGAGRNTATGGPFYAYFDNLNSPPGILGTATVTTTANNLAVAAVLGTATATFTANLVVVPVPTRETGIDTKAFGMTVSAAPGSGSALLLETGDVLTLETGDHLVLES